MKSEILEKANTLQDDIYTLKHMINEYDGENHAIYIASTNSNGRRISKRLQKELVEWLKIKKQEYEKEFEEL